MLMRRAALFATTAIVTAGLTVSRANAEDLASLDLATLMNMDVTITSAARRAQVGADAAAAVFVLTREDIRRTGATSVPEALRGVPGMQVARISNQAWMVTARGFSSRYANKLLVLVDGRSIYTHNFSGVAWEDQHVPLEQIDRIEVVRGPGGALWGANAVNGVINIITRSAADAQGLHIASGVGAEERAAELHYGGVAGRAGHYRVYVEGIAREAFDERLSDWERLQAGWRFDNARFTFQGDVHATDLSGELSLGAPQQPMQVEGGNFSASWRGTAFERGTLELQGYYSWNQYDRDGSAVARESMLGLDLQFSAARAGRHLLTAGAGYRNLRDDLAGLATVGIDYAPHHAAQDLWSLYAQDEIHFLQDDLRVIVGAKLEGYRFTGDALQPTVRGIWRLDDRHTLWAAASRAVRTPARFDLHGTTTAAEIPGAAPGAPAVRLVLAGNSAAEEEHLHAYEAGWRWRPAERLSFDIAIFEHVYHDVLQALPASALLDAGPPPAVVQRYQYANDLDTRTQGTEIAVDWIAARWLRLQASASWFHMTEQRAPAALAGPEDSDAEHLLRLNARLDLSEATELDLTWRRVGERSAWGIDAYDIVNLTAAWRPARSAELSVAIENLFDREHVEFFDERGQVPGAVLGRTAFVRVRWSPHR